jgi:molybdopterin-guanine dinucleotide biosynthesis protein A
MPAWAVIALTGGGSRRMGRDKATLDVGGATLLDRTLADVPPEIPVVVAGPPVRVARPGVRFAQEDPPGGGPVAGVGAALTLVVAPIVVVLAADLPLVGSLPAALAGALVDTDGAIPQPDAVLAVDASGRPQQLCAAYRTGALRRAVAEVGSAEGAAMREVVGRLRTVTLSIIAVRELRGEPVELDPTWDIDTPEDLYRLEALLDEGTTDT